jgi:7-keto-8-aminopelargonate synthetase-like enzyme
LDVVQSEPARRQRVIELAGRLRRSLVHRGVDCLRSEGPIVPVVLGDSQRTVRIAERIRRRGFDVRAIRPPAVAPRTARIRISVHADHTDEQVDALSRALLDELATESVSQPTISVRRGTP